MHKLGIALILTAAATLTTAGGQAGAAGPRVEISFTSDVSAAPLDGRMLLFISKAASGEPRNQVNEDALDTQQMFGIDVDGLKPGQPAVFDASVFGYPVASLRDIPAGDYTVQGLLNVYTTYHLANGHVVKLPADQGEGQRFARKPGNPFSTPQKVHFDPSGPPIRIQLTQKNQPVTPPADTTWVKHLRFQSKLLTDFWGTPTYIGVNVVLPEGFDTHPDSHYPLVVLQDHFSPDLSRQFPAQPRAGSLGEDWETGKMPKMLLISIQHANPYYDDSYAVNSANLGPYGDAIVHEVIPQVEKQFRGIGQGWARADFGCSTGGWEAIADQVFYPDDFNGAWSNSPDPIDFNAYQIVNLYKDKNAYWLEGPWASVPRPAVHEPDGQVIQTMDRALHRELVLGTHGRSTMQFGIWQAVFSPVGPDGYPANIWDPMTGVIDHSVAQYWHDHYDLVAWMQAHWATLGPKLDGKLHMAVGDEDTYYLDNAVYLLQDFVNKSENPHISATFDFGRRQPHCYDGTYRRTTEEQKYMPEMADRMVKTAPAGADMSWRYDH